MFEIFCLERLSVKCVLSFLSACVLWSKTVGILHIKEMDYSGTGVNGFIDCVMSDICVLGFVDL